MDSKKKPYQVKVSVDAHKDIDDITTYITDDLQNPRAASGFLDDVLKSYDNVATNPFMYSLCVDERLRRKGYRKIPIKNYLIFYRVNRTGKIVWIVRVLYSARDYSNLL